MTPQDFCFWLQGYVEMGGDAPTDAQWEMIKEHLGLVFDKQTSTLSELTENLPDLDVPAPEIDLGRVNMTEQFHSWFLNDQAPKPNVIC